MNKHSLKPTTVSIELDALRSDVAHAFELVIEGARDLEVAGRIVFHSLLDAGFDDRGDELREHAARVRCGARRAAAVASELESMAGRLDGIALVRVLVEQGPGTGQAHRAARPAGGGVPAPRGGR